MACFIKSTLTDKKDTEYIRTEISYKNQTLCHRRRREIPAHILLVWCIFPTHTQRFRLLPEGPADESRKTHGGETKINIQRFAASSKHYTMFAGKYKPTVWGPLGTHSNHCWGSRALGKRKAHTMARQREQNHTIALPWCFPFVRYLEMFFFFFDSLSHSLIGKRL